MQTYIPPPTSLKRTKSGVQTSPSPPRRPIMRRAQSAPVGTRKDREEEARRVRNRWQQAIFRAAALHRDDSLEGLQGGRRHKRRSRRRRRRKRRTRKRRRKRRTRKRRRCRCRK